MTCCWCSGRFCQLGFPQETQTFSSTWYALTPVQDCVVTAVAFVTKNSFLKWDLFGKCQSHQWWSSIVQATTCVHVCTLCLLERGLASTRAVVWHGYWVSMINMKLLRMGLNPQGRIRKLSVKVKAQQHVRSGLKSIWYLPARWIAWNTPTSIISRISTYKANRKHSSKQHHLQILHIISGCFTLSLRYRGKHMWPILRLWSKMQILQHVAPGCCALNNTYM